MLIVSLLIAVVGMRTATLYTERESAMALVSPGGPTIVEADAPPTAAGGGEASSTDATATTTTEAPRGAAVSSASSAEEPGEAPSDGSPQERGRWALTQIGYPWEDMLPGWRVEFLDGRTGLFGLTLVDDKRIEIYVRDNQADDLLVHIVAHELGHAVDVTLNDGDDRRTWQAARGIEDEPWWPSSAASDFRTGAGDFAESFAYWQAESAHYRSKLGPAPSAEQLRVIAELAAG